MTEEELREANNVLENREALLNMRERDLLIFEGRIRREYAKLFPGIEVKFRGE